MQYPSVVFALFGALLLSTPSTVDENKLWIGQNDPNPYHEDERTNIRYRALDVEIFSIVFFNAHGDRVLVFDQLKDHEGSITLKPNQFVPGEYRYALVVYNRMGPRKTLTVLPRKN